eukprot:CAMPEP_0170542100 /NCGR_PEP_ID=MMETSP0211-20121228/1632_1 /TAXON_ID=311385 /ORGANISM="Pseudokeronopsis sp., Strain OXSARD2" /LENGTH=116 /DNA_ID=CAMNT_0010845053 /DNA_START=1774 /DNA_END=2124 /DNA_ORIENTATION=+
MVPHLKGTLVFGVDIHTEMDVALELLVVGSGVGPPPIDGVTHQRSFQLGVQKLVVVLPQCFILIRKGTIVISSLVNAFDLALELPFTDVRVNEALEHFLLGDEVLAVREVVLLLVV